MTEEQDELHRDPKYKQGYADGWNDGRIDGRYDIVEMLEAEIGEPLERMQAVVEAIVKEFGPQNDPRLKGTSHARSRRRGSV